MSKIKIILLSLTMLAPAAAEAQDNQPQEQEEKQLLVLDPLFEYPSTPDEIEWKDRSNWLMEHFWDNFDTNQNAVGQIQLNHAFKTWCVPLRLADKNVALESAHKLIKRVEKNPTLLLQLTKAAEYNIYDPATAEIWADDFYIPFLEALVSNKKVPKLQKPRYAMQLERLKNSAFGAQLPAFSYRDRTGLPAKFDTGQKYMIVEFGDPDCNECQMTRIELKLNDVVSRYINEGKLGLAFILPDADPADTDWMESVSDYPDNWTVGAAEDLDTKLDLKLTPSLYLLSPQGLILQKNSDVKSVVLALEELLGSAAGEPVEKSVGVLDTDDTAAPSAEIEPTQPTE